MSIDQENTHQFKTMRENLKFLRKSRKWSIEELSKISKIDVESLMRIEGDEEVDVRHLFSLCRIYDIRVYDAFFPLDKQEKQICRVAAFAGLNDFAVPSLLRGQTNARCHHAQRVA